MAMARNAVMDGSTCSGQGLPSPLSRHRCLSWSPRGSDIDDRTVPEETAVALVYDGATEAVMMATPANIEDFAIGFSLTEGLIQKPADIADIAVVPQTNGIETRIWLAPDARFAVRNRRRRLAGPVGCGLCGIASLAEAVRPSRSIVGDAQLDAAMIQRAVQALGRAQSLNAASRAMHAAGFFRPRRGLAAVREDVGRHNALDKLAGALARDAVDPSEGAVVITSRVSVEMVQKTAAIGAPILIAVSAPTALAIRAAQASGLTLVALARGAAFEVFTHPGRIRLKSDRPRRSARCRAAQAGAM
jgi:FdhD protein